MKANPPSVERSGNPPDVDLRIGQSLNIAATC